MSRSSRRNMGARSCGGSQVLLVFGLEISLYLHPYSGISLTWLQFHGSTKKQGACESAVLSSMLLRMLLSLVWNWRLGDQGSMKLATARHKNSRSQDGASTSKTLLHSKNRSLWGSELDRHVLLGVNRASRMW